jgi:hypothetical protein
MKDLRCTVGLHAYPMPGKDHPVFASGVKAGQLTLHCPRCQKTQSIEWRHGPPPREVSPPMGFG